MPDKDYFAEVKPVMKQEDIISSRIIPGDEKISAAPQPAAVRREIKPEITVSDIDYDIPVNANQYRNRFALIIGNEDYSSKNISLAPEVNVDFAINDAVAFSQYARSLMGVPDENIIFLENATSVEMQKAVNKLNLIART